MSLIMSRRGTYRVGEPLPCLFLFKLIYLSALSLTGLSSRPQLIAAFLYYAPSTRLCVHSNLNVTHVREYNSRVIPPLGNKRRRLFEKIIPTIQSFFHDRPSSRLPRLILPPIFRFFDNPFYTTDRFPRWLGRERIDRRRAFFSRR